MTEELEIEVGDQVEFDTNWYTVKRIREEQIKTIKAGTIIYKRLYFKEPHAPVYFHEVQNWRKKGTGNG